MIHGKRRTIGVFNNRTDNYFNEVVFRKIQAEAKRLDYDVIVFSTVGYHQSNNYYDTQEKGMLSFAPVEQLDGILAMPDTYELHGFRDDLMSMLKERVHCPMVSVRYRDFPGDRVYTDDYSAIRMLMEHLTEVHGAKRICFMAGYQGHPDSDLRLKIFREEMERRGLEVPEAAVCHANMWVSDGPIAYRQFYEENRLDPEAIICANDYMAIGLVNTLNRNGIRVPDDVIVTGYDNVDNFNVSNMTLTTVAQDYELMVSQAMELLDRKIRGEAGDEGNAAGETIGLPGRLVLGESCGCGKTKHSAINAMLRLNASGLNRMRDNENKITYLSIELSTCETLQELHDILLGELTVQDVSGRRDFHLCLFEQENEEEGKKERSFSEEITERACLVTSVRNRQDGGMPMISFDTGCIVPPMLEDAGEAQVFFLTLLHQKDHTFGYALTRYDDGAVPDEFFHQWNVIISGALWNMHARKQLLELYEERRISSVTDMMTRMFNRRGLEEQLNPQWNSLCMRRENIACIYFDGDNTKKINDNYSHLAGDFAIVTLACAIRHAAPENAVLARMGGDEFLAVLPQSGKKTAEQFAIRFEKELRKLNVEADRTFTVECSYGIYVTRLNENSTIEKMIQESDARMHAVKCERHAERK